MCILHISVITFTETKNTNMGGGHPPKAVNDKTVNDYRIEFVNWISNNGLPFEKLTFPYYTIYRIFQTEETFNDFKALRASEVKNFLNFSYITCFDYGHVLSFKWCTTENLRLFEISQTNRCELTTASALNFRGVLPPKSVNNKEEFDNEFTQMLEEFCKQ